MKMEDDKIIVFDSYVTPLYLYWLCMRFRDKRILFWYWNPVGNNPNFGMFPRRVELWSYGPADCDRYGFRNNSQFYFDCLVPNAEEIPLYSGMETGGKRPRVFFLGRDKGRKQDILNIKTLLEQNGADTEFHIMKDGKRKNRHAEPLMPYLDVIARIRDCDVLLDYTLSDNAGLSLRPLEAMYFGKKLITNQKEIRQHKLYREENIYILGDEDRSLKEFLEEPFVMPDQEIRDYYLLSSWLKRFDLAEDEKS